MHRKENPDTAGPPSGNPVIATVADYIQSLKAADAFSGQVVDHRTFSSRKPAFDQPQTAWPSPVAQMLRTMGIDALYRHQVEAVDRIRQGHHTVIATATASGKTLTYTLPVIETALADEAACALFIYPLKALAQDQLKTVQQLAGHLDAIKLRADIYDGDTSSYRRKKIRDNPPHILMTNPEMVHLSICPHHDRWADLLKRLRYIVVDEVHTYRGILGTHMAQVLRRLLRLCRHYGSAPTFIFTSATVANPDELARQLTGLEVASVKESTAGVGKRHLLVLDPVDGPLTATVLLLQAALGRGLRTIVYTQSRKLTELLAIWAKNRSGAYAERISAYRAGFLPEERREIEARLASGDLLAVITTSALELGIDIGSLDLCILVGYPGSIVSTWQRGGRVGRSGRESAVVMVAAENALDHFFVMHPEQLVERGPEAAVVNAGNPDVAGRHLVCAAAELTLKCDDPYLDSEAMQSAARQMVAAGELFISAEGDRYLSPLKNPHRKVDLRGSGSRFAIVDVESERTKGEIDGFRVYRETHPGAIYLHRGQTFRVERLDLEARKVWAAAARVNYHTRVRSHKDTEILDVMDQKAVYGTTMAIGRLRVTEQVTGFDRIHTRSGKVLERCDLELPPMIFETQGLWFGVSSAIVDQAEAARMHVMGGLHALEHAAIGVFPLLVMADRNDLGGISTPYHAQLGCAGIFIYDGLPGGAGLCFQAFADGLGLLDTTLTAISDCPCETGCPSCVHSPKCGSGNRPIDKAAAVFLLKTIQTVDNDPGQVPIAPMIELVEPVAPNQQSKEAQKDQPLRYGVFDIETQRSAAEVGGWHRASKMRVSCAVLYDSQGDAFYEYVEGQVPMLLEHLLQMDLVIGFNVKRFDYQVLSAYTDMDFSALPTLDLLEKVKGRLGYRLSLDHLASVTLDAGKIADGLDALRWWKEGKMAKILEYCRSDVAITRDLYLYGRDKGYVLFENKAKQTVRLPVVW